MCYFQGFSGEFVGATKRLSPFRKEFFFWDHTVKPKHYLSPLCFLTFKAFHRSIG